MECDNGESVGYQINLYMHAVGTIEIALTIFDCDDCECLILGSEQIYWEKSISPDIDCSSLNESVPYYDDNDTKDCGSGTDQYCGCDARGTNALLTSS